MARTLIAVAWGLAVLVLVAFLGSTLAWVAVGPDRVFESGSWRTTTLWDGIGAGVAFVASLAAGWMCARRAHAKRAPYLLAAIVVLFGIVRVLLTMRQVVPEGELRTADVVTVAMLGKAQMPLWSLLVHPIVGAIGVLIGAGRRTVPGNC